MKDRIDFAAALEAGAIKPDSAAAQLATADAEAARALGAAVLAELPLGPATSEDEEAWAAFGLGGSAEDSWDFVADALDVAEIPAMDSVEVLADESAVLAPARPDVFAPTAPQFVKAPPPNRSWMYGVAAMLLAGIGAFGLWFALDDKDGSGRFDSPATPASVASASVAQPGSGLVQAPASRTPASVAMPSTVASMAPATTAPASIAAPASAAPRSADTAATKPKRRRASRRRAAPKAVANNARKAAPKPAARRRKTSGVDDLLSNLDGGGRKAPARANKPAAALVDPTLPAKLSKSQILRVVRRNAGKIGGCKSPDASGTVMVQMVIAPNGRVQSAKPKGKFAGTPAGVCVASKVRTFRFPQFSGDAMRINMPFRL